MNLVPVTAELLDQRWTDFEALLIDQLGVFEGDAMEWIYHANEEYVAAINSDGKLIGAGDFSAKWHIDGIGDGGGCLTMYSADPAVITAIAEHFRAQHKSTPFYCIMTQHGEIETRLENLYLKLPRINTPMDFEVVTPSLTKSQRKKIAAYLMKVDPRIDEETAWLMTKHQDCQTIAIRDGEIIGFARLMVTDWAHNGEVYATDDHELTVLTLEESVACALADQIAAMNPALVVHELETLGHTYEAKPIDLYDAYRNRWHELLAVECNA